MRDNFTDQAADAQPTFEAVLLATGIERDGDDNGVETSRVSSAGVRLLMAGLSAEGRCHRATAR